MLPRKIKVPELGVENNGSSPQMTLMNADNIRSSSETHIGTTKIDIWRGYFTQ